MLSGRRKTIGVFLCKAYVLFDNAVYHALEEEALSGVPMHWVILPAGITGIEADALACQGLAAVTFTGGEATLQWDALETLLTALHERGVHTALETNGSHPRLPELFDRIDWLILDCKHPDDETHRRVIGASNRQTLRNLRAAAEMRAQLLVRIPLVGGFNDSVQDAERFAEALSCLRDGHDVEVLRYHEYGRDKWKQCGMEYTVHDAFVPDETYRQFCAVLRDSGLHLIST